VYVCEREIEFDFAPDCNDVLMMLKETYVCTKRLIYV